jgi:hypothetical protein
VSLTTNTNRTKSDIYGSRDDISSSMESRRSESRVEEIYFFFFPGSRIRAIRQVSTGRREGVSRTGSEDFLTLPDVDSGKVHDLRGKNNSTRIEGHFSIELYSQEATHHIPHHSRQVPRVNWDTILSSPKKNPPTSVISVARVTNCKYILTTIADLKILVGNLNNLPIIFRNPLQSLDHHVQSRINM